MSAVRRLTSVVLAGLGVLAGSLALGGAPASAAFVHHVLPPEAGFGSFGHVTGVAVDQSSENVFAVDSGSEANVVRVFGPEGLSPLGGAPAELPGLHAPFEFNQERIGIAVDNACYLSGKSGAACTSFDPSNDDIYVPNVRGGGEVLEKFRLNASDEYEYVCQFTGYGGLTGSACEKEPARSPTTHFQHPVGAAVDSKGDVYVDEDGGSKAIYEFNSAGEEVEGPIANPTEGSPLYLAVDADGDLFVVGGEFKVFELKRKPAGGYEPGVEIAGGALVTGVAVDPVHNLLYIDFAFHVSEYSLNGGGLKLLSEFGAGTIGVSFGLGVNDSSGDVYVSDFGFGVLHIFGPALIVPETRTAGVSGLSLGEATLQGEVDPDSGTLAITTCEFQYGPGEVEPGAEPVYASSVPCSSLPGPGEAFTAVSAQATGLVEPYSPYHYRLVSGNENGITYGANQTLLSFKVPPVVDAKAGFASEVSQLSATLNGTIDPIGVPTSYHFVYGTTSAYGSVAPFPEQYVANDRATHAVSQTIGGLAPGTTYHYALAANSPGGTTTGPDETFTTPPVPAPVVTTGGAGEVSVNSATLTGTVDPQGWETGYYFEYGPTAAYGSRWPTLDVTLGALTGGQPVVTFLQNLQPGTLYHYRLVASNPGATSYGADQTFQTPEYPASVIQETPVLKTPLGINPETKSSAKAPAKHKTKRKRPGGRPGAGRRGRFHPALRACACSHSSARPTASTDGVRW
jgi:hypothetical protein